MRLTTLKTLLGAGAFALLLAVPTGPLEAQNPAVFAGRVVSDLGVPVPGVVVFVAELAIEVQTNEQGQYTLTIPGDRVRGQTVLLRARAIGFRPGSREITVSAGRQTVDFTLATDIHMLEAVVVTGVTAGTEAVKVPFTVDRVDASQLPVVASNPLTQLQGKVPGANIVSNSGRPGAQPAVLLRGPKSINTQGRSQEPLYIVDGVIVRGGLPDINPQDIESVEIVKGAAASSLYGAEAGNGVVNIITKSGKNRADEGVTFTVRTEYGKSDIERDFGIARRHALMLDETGTRFCQTVSGQATCARTFDYLQAQSALNNTPGVTVPAGPQFPVDPGSGISGPALRTRYQIEKWPHPTYNAVDMVVHPQPVVQSSVDMTGRVGGTSFFTSMSHFDQGGAIRFLDGFQRTSGRVNVDQQIGSDWQVGVRTFYSHTTSDGSNQDGGGTAFFRLTRAPAVVNPLARDTLGRIYIRPNLQTGGLQNENPLYSLENTHRLDEGDRFLGGLQVRWAPLTWLDLDGNFSYDLSKSVFEQINDKGFRSNFNTAAVQGGNIFQGSSTGKAYNSSLSATVRRSMGDLGTTWTARWFYQRDDDEIRTLQGNFLAVQGVKAAGNTTQNRTINSSFESARQMSFAGGLALDFKDRYIADGVIRRDGSSLFGSANRWDTYGRASVAWRLAEEPWWFISSVSEFKLRGSYGTAGNSPRFSAQYETFTIGAGGVVSFGVMGNANLRPEKVREYEGGADVELWNRILLGVTYAQSETKDALLPVPVPATTGFGTQWQNAATLENKTWELSLSVPIIRTRDLTWSTRVVYDRTRTTVTELSVPPFNFGSGLQATDAMFRLEEGELFGTFYGRYFLKTCSELPTAFQAQCGGAASAFQVNDDGFLVWVGQGNTWQEGITKNLWQAQLPATQAPYGYALNWGMPIIMRDSALGSASQVPLGHSLPDFRYAISTDFQWKRLTLYALLDASIGQSVWNQGYHWAHLDFLSADVDQTDKTIQTAKPIGYYYRAAPPDNSAGIGGLYDILAPNNFTVEKASYAKLREAMIGYRIGQIAGLGDWQVSLVGRNLYTFTDYRGFDPEVGISGGQAGSAAINAVDAFTFPNLRSVTFGVSTTF